MMTYLILNVVFMAIVLVAVGFRRRYINRSLIITLIILLGLTAVFDNVIIGLGIVDYDPAKIIGLKLLYAPIEDFMYAILAVLIVPVIWKKLGAQDVKQSQ